MRGLEVGLGGWRRALEDETPRQANVVSLLPLWLIANGGRGVFSGCAEESGGPMKPGFLNGFQSVVTTDDLHLRNLPVLLEKGLGWQQFLLPEDVPGMVCR